ncbi:hypothetical protein [Methylobacterium marchantiae]|uniref:Phasin domain-containing protein n=1 Tax=Methylobacterium marchantiae TaxID=600331 RepID=A0ABW3WY11_9HYPH|nr:hypothetical protein AIGOOFII_1515 [Methylobacterium marchantiae]
MTDAPQPAPLDVDAAAELQDTILQAGDDGTAVPSTLDTVEPSVGEALMESVSQEALLSGQAADEVSTIGADAVPDDAHSPEPALPQAEALEDVVAVPVSAVGTIAAEAQDGDAVHTEKAPDESTAQPDSLLPAEIESAIASAQAVAPQQQRVVAVSALSEITAANDTLAAYLRNESLATFAHWGALSSAKNPADAIRLQVNEMQRAADASLSCIASLARRAGRIAATVRRS